MSKLLSKVNESTVYIIAEAGVNHGGDIDLAKKLVDVAVEAGADAVKFQAFRTKNLILDNVEKAPYQVESTGATQSQTEMLTALELRTEHYTELMGYCNSKGIDFLITPFDEGSLIELEEIGVEVYKIASTDTTNIPLLREVAKTGKTVILSTGMSYLDEVKLAMKTLQEHTDSIVLMQCTANYPIEDHEANLNVLHTYSKEFDCILGYSDHTVGLGASLYAIPMGAQVVEKHFTLNKEDDGPDHRASLDPEELKDYVAEIRRIESMLGSFEKQPTPSEMKTRASLQKCLVASQPIELGEQFSKDNLVAKRTGGVGVSPIHVDRIYGQMSNRAYAANDIIEFNV